MRKSVFNKNYVIIFNGLGNQIGQIAFFLHIKNVLGKDVSLVSVDNRSDQANIRDLFNLSSLGIRSSKLIELIFRIAISPRLPRIARRVMNMSRILTVYQEPTDLRYRDGEVKRLTSRGITLFSGGWHDQSIHNAQLEVIRSMISKSKSSRLGSDEYYSDRTCPIVGVHVRGGDYLIGEEANKYGNIATSTYYKDAIALAEKNIPNARFVYFTDDRPYVIDLLGPLEPTFANNDSASEDFLDLMSCDALIIGNSSFAYWAARLAEHAKFVIRPGKFSQVSDDVTYPDFWIKLTND